MIIIEESFGIIQKVLVAGFDGHTIARVQEFTNKFRSEFGWLRANGNAGVGLDQSSAGIDRKNVFGPGIHSSYVKGHTSNDQ